MYIYIFLQYNYRVCVHLVFKTCLCRSYRLITAFTERSITLRPRIYASCLQTHKFVSKINFGRPILLPDMSSSYKLSYPLSISDHPLYGFIISAMRAKCLIRHFSHDFVSVILLMENKIIMLLIMQLSAVA
jgi:hypothetical protein